MVFDEFKHIIAESIKGYLKEREVDEVRLVNITKNNDTKKTGIIVMEKDESITPTIYLEDYYDRYQEGQDLEDIMQDIVTCFEGIKQRGSNIYKRDYSELMDYENIKNQIIVRVVGLEKNQEYLADKVYDVKKDMALVYFILVGKEESNEDITLDHTVKILIYYENVFDSVTVLQEEIKEKLKSYCENKATIYITDEGKLIQIVNQSVNKMREIEKIRKILTLDKDEIAVFGDDVNDIEMLSEYQYSVAMGNASREVKAVAKIITNDNNHDGIYSGINKLLE